MSEKPTAEQVAEARDFFLAPDPQGPLRPTDVHRHIQTLLAATEPPTDEELAEEAESAWSAARLPIVTLRQYRAVYIAGAQRKGRR